MTDQDMTARRVAGFAAYAAIERLPQPAIAVVHGAAFGSGCEIAAACDFILAAEGTQFCYPEVGWGTVGARSAWSTMSIRPPNCQAAPPRWRRPLRAPRP